MSSSPFRKQKPDLNRSTEKARTPSVRDSGQFQSLTAAQFESQTRDVKKDNAALVGSLRDMLQAAPAPAPATTAGAAAGTASATRPARDNVFDDRASDRAGGRAPESSVVRVPQPDASAVRVPPADFSAVASARAPPAPAPATAPAQAAAPGERSAETLLTAVCLRKLLRARSDELAALRLRALELETREADARAKVRALEARRDELELERRLASEKVSDGVRLDVEELDRRLAAMGDSLERATADHAQEKFIEEIVARNKEFAARSAANGQSLARLKGGLEALKQSLLQLNSGANSSVA